MTYIIRIWSKFFRKIFEFFFENFSIFLKTFRMFRSFEIFPEMGRAETIRLVRKSSNFELSSRFSDRLKIFTGLGSQNSY